MTAEVVAMVVGVGDTIKAVTMTTGAKTAETITNSQKKQERARN
jgi:hypothetical protein